MKRKQQLEVGEGENLLFEFLSSRVITRLIAMGQDFWEKTKYARTGEKNYLKFRHNENCWGNYANFIRKSNALSRTSKGPFPVPNPIPFPALCPAFLPLRVLFSQAAKKAERKCGRKVKVRFMQLQIHLAMQSVIPAFTTRNAPWCTHIFGSIY